MSTKKFLCARKKLLALSETSGLSITYYNLYIVKLKKEGTCVVFQVIIGKWSTNKHDSMNIGKIANLESMILGHCTALREHVISMRTSYFDINSLLRYLSRLRWSTSNRNVTLKMCR